MESPRVFFYVSPKLDLLRYKTTENEDSVFEAVR